jgi:hypothetical protein
MKDLAQDLDIMVEQGMSANEISVTLGVSYDLAMQAIESRGSLELEKQYEMLSYAEESANDDAQYYGEE